MNSSIGKLSVVATPIGNMGDITFRAIETLNNCDLVIAEDTRVSAKLLNHYNIKKPISSYHSQSKISSTEKIIEQLQEGKNLCLISDAGTPTISDPGSLLIHTIKQALPDIKIECIPGPSALIGALSVSGVRTENFVFYGFLPHKKGRKTTLEEISSNTKTCVFYESTHRILKVLGELSTMLPENKMITVCKELTKIHERIMQGSAEQIIDILKSDVSLTKGEFVVIVSNL